MRLLFDQLRRLESTKVSVLISGESGTGKELIARAIHDHSPVRGGPFVVVNCGALDRQLARSELFGHERGAFTGAVRRHAGAFEAAQGGTVFLDEVGELPLEVQPVLLRALERREITPVGSVDERRIDVRLVAATHRALSARVSAGHFREDLLYRIRVVELVMPPLRERPEDVAALAQAFAAQHGVHALEPTVIEALCRHHWPGNVRELRNAVEAFVVMGALPGPARPAQDPCVDRALARFIDLDQTYSNQKNELVRRFTIVYLEHLLESTGGNQSEAARLAGLERSYLGRLIDKLGVKRR